MIDDEAIAKEISQLMVEFGERLNASVALVQRSCSAEEFKVYRRVIGKVMGEMLLEIMTPLYQRYHGMKPKELL